MKRKDKPSIFEIRGKLGDKVYYRLDGQKVSRSYARVPLQVYRAGENFAELRKQQSEFGLASQYGKTIRQALDPYLDIFKNTDCSGRLTGALRQCLKQGSGEIGERIFTPSCLEGLHTFPFHKKYPFSSSFSYEIHLDFDEESHALVIQTGPSGLYYPDYLRPIPATILAGMIWLSAVEYRDGYQLLQPEFHGMCMLGEVPIEVLRENESYRWTFDEMVADDKEEDAAGSVLPPDMLKVGVFGYLSEDGNNGKGWLMKLG